MAIVTDWGAVSSWVAAGISVTAFGAGTVRAIWNRPQVDWALTGEMKWPNRGSVPDDEKGRVWLETLATISNFGDGDAHRVSVHIHRGDAPESQILATHPLLKPGDKLDINVGVLAQHWDNTHIWLTWTSPPIRRHREQSSPRLLVSEHLEQSKGMRENMAKPSAEEGNS